MGRLPGRYKPSSVADADFRYLDLTTEENGIFKHLCIAHFVCCKLYLYFDWLAANNLHALKMYVRNVGRTVRDVKRRLATSGPVEILMSVINWNTFILTFTEIIRVLDVDK